MIITCGECDSSFVLDDSLVKSSGSKVRCSSCKNIFVAYPSAPKSTPPAPARKVKAKKKPAVAPEKSAAPAVTHPVGAEQQSDPDFIKAVDAINEDELEFTDEELGIDSKVESGRAKEVEVPAAVPVAEELAVPDEPDAEESSADEDLLDFADFELDIDTPDVLADASDKVEEPALGSAEDDLEFSDLELGEDVNDEPQVEADEDELDFSDLELELGGVDEAAPAEETATPENISLDLGQDFSDDADTVAIEGESLDFSDIELEMDVTPPQIPEVDDELAGLGLDEDTEHATESMLDDEELDFSDLELALDDSSDALDDEPASVEDLDLDLDMEDSGVEPETVLLDEDELDFSGFELDDDEPEGAVEDDMDLGMEDVSEPGLTEETPPPVPGAEEEELDFSDLANFLDSEQPAENEPIVEEDPELELDLDLGTGDQAENIGEATGAEEELDFSDLENMLDDVDDLQVGDVASPAADVDLELDLAMDDDSSEEDLDLEIAPGDDTDFSDVEAMLGSDDSLDDSDDLDLDLTLDDNEDDSMSLGNDVSDDIELELDIDDSAVSSEEEIDEFDIDEIDDAALVEEPEEKPDKKKKVRKKPRRKAAGKGKLFIKLFLLVFILLFMALAVYLSSGQIENRFGYKMMKVDPLEELRDVIGGMEVPYLSQWVKPEPKDPEGKLGLKTLRITGKIVPNEKVGDIFVITGKVQNMYEETRNSIRLVGKLFGQGDKVAQTRLFFAGNVIPEEELVTLDADVITKKLQNRLGDNGVNTKVRPGQIVPFMVVFTNLSEDLSEFSVEPAGSSQGAAIK